MNLNGEMKYWFKKIFYYPVMRVKRFIDYAPLIWMDEDYDWSAILRMLQYKIKRNRLHIDDHKFFDGYKDRVEEMLEAERVIERILKEDWMSSAQDAYFEKYPISWQDGPEEDEMQLRPSSSGKQRSEWRAIRKKVIKLEKTDWDRLGHLIVNNLRGWWD